MNRIMEYERKGSPQRIHQPEPMATDISSRLSSVLKQASGWIVEHPEIALGSALVVGGLLGWLIKRR